MENNENLLAAIEAILFVYGEPMDIKKIAKILKTEESQIKSALDELAQNFETDNGGLRIVFSGNQAQLATKPEFSNFLESFIKEEFKEQLSPASVETLSLVAYLGPISRPEIDYYRGVNSSFILRSLLVRGLVERSADVNRGNIYLYRPSFDLLKYLGISKVEDLPEYEKFKEMKNMETPEENKENKNETIISETETTIIIENE